MEDKLEQLRDEAVAAFQNAEDEEQLEQARVEYLGRHGRLREAMASIANLPEERRPIIGSLANRASREMEQAYQQRQQELAQQAAAQEPGEQIDVTLPGRASRVGRRHPLLATLDEMIEIFLGLGFTVAEGPEVENYYYSFEALNYPEFHPAMDEQMTFYIGDDALLRSQTSPVQIRVMEQQQPPVRIVAPGRCFRRDTVDATHCHTFYQLEGLLVDEGVTFADLKGTLEVFAREMFGPSCHMRFRPDFFPFTEPSAEVCLTCMICEGAGCRACEHTGWMEIGGSGMVDPNVLAGVGYDTEKYTGFAFGVGVERLAMLRHGIDDIRLFYSGDMRFLEQF